MSEILNLTTLKQYLTHLPSNQPVDFYAILDHFQVNPYTPFSMHQHTTNLEKVFDQLRILNYDEINHHLKNIMQKALDRNDYPTVMQLAKTGQRLQNDNAYLYFDRQQPQILTNHILIQKLTQFH